MIEQAAQWAAALDAGDMGEKERLALAAWCAKDPLHQTMLDHMRAFDDRVDRAEDFERAALHAMLERNSSSYARRGGGLLGIALLVAFGWAGIRSDFARDYFPDYQTGRGELRTLALADGSEAVIDTNSAIGIDLDEGRREVRLISGQLFAKVAKGRRAPFVVKTAHGSATALGTAFAVRREQNYTLVTVIESHVRVCPGSTAANEKQCRILSAGERARVTSARVSTETPVDPSMAAMWSSGWLEADDEDVADVLAELSRYSRRPIRFDAASLEGVKITGSFPLRDIDRAIEGVGRTGNLQVRRSAQEILVTRRF